MKKYIKKFGIENSLITIAIIAISVVQVGTSLIHTFAFNSLLENNISGFIKWYAIGLILWLTYIIGTYFLEIVKTKVIQGMVLEMRKDYVSRITQETFVNYKSRDVGEYVSTLNNDMNLIESSGFNSIFNMISTLILTLLSLVTLFTFDYRIMLITVTLSLVLTFIPNLLTNRISEATKTYSTNNSEFLSRIHDILTGYETLYYLGNKKRIVNQIVTTSEKFKQSKVNYTKESELVNSVISTISVFAQILIMVATGYFAYTGSVSFGAITSTASVSGNVFSSLSSFNKYLMNIKSVKPLIEKISNSSIVDIKIDNLDKDISLTRVDSLYIRDLSFSFEGKRIFDKFNLEIKKGGKYAVIGSSGSGKSTLVNIILGNLKNYEGNVLINEVELKDVNENKIINQISFVGSKVHIYHDTLLNNITLWDDYSDSEINTALSDSNLEELKHRLLEQTNEKELSEGQKQRIGLARAFLKKRQFIILDEATANLDSSNALEIENLILSKDGLTYITVTHHLKDNRYDLFDRIITLSNLTAI